MLQKENGGNFFFGLCFRWKTQKFYNPLEPLFKFPTHGERDWDPYWHNNTLIIHFHLVWLCLLVFKCFSFSLEPKHQGFQVVWQCPWNCCWFSWQFMRRYVNLAVDTFMPRLSHQIYQFVARCSSLHEYLIGDALVPLRWTIREIRGLPIEG